MLLVNNTGKSMERDRMISFVFSILITLGAGSLYGFGAYSADLQNRVGENVDILGSCGDVGLYTGFTIGMFGDKFGGRKCIALATLLLSGGYFMCWLILRETFGPPSLPLLGVCYFILGQGSFGMFVTALTTQIKNFDEKHRGKVTGFIMMIFGLSSILFTFIYSTFCHNDVEQLYSVFFVTELILGILGFFTVANIPSLHADGAQDEPLMVDTEYTSEIETTVAVDVTGLDLIKDKHFWVYFLMFFCFTGPSLMFKNIIGTIGTAFHFSSGEVSAMVYLWSSFNSLFRIVIGALADYFTTKPGFRLTRPFWLVVLGLLTGVSCLAYLVLKQHSIYIIVIAIAFVYGAAFSTVGTQVSIYFGKKNFGFNMGMMTLAPAVSGVAYTELSSLFSNAEIADNEKDCYGFKCFTETFLLSGITYIIAGMLSFYAVLLERKRAKM